MKRFNIYTFFLLPCILMLIACGNGKPSGVISEEKMKAVLWDVAMAGEYANGYVYYQNPMQNRVAINNELMNEIFKVHGVTKKEFDKSLEYYKQNPKVLMKMLDSIAAKHGAPTAQPKQGPDLGTTPGVQPPVPATPLPTPEPMPVDTSSKRIAPVNEF